MAIYHRNKITDPFRALMSNINASQFFPQYAPNVKNWRAKLRGNDGRGVSYFFLANDIEDIEEGLKRLSKEMSSYKKEKQLGSKNVKDNSLKK